jgi:acyl-CoA thioesterase-1
MLLRILLLLFCLVSPAALAGDPVILVLGDSLSAGYGIDIRYAWVNLLQSRLQEKGYAYKVVNASISGDTTRGGLTRLDGLLTKHQPAIVIVELGGNDGLRGLSLNEVRDNLTAIVKKAQGQGAKVLLPAMRLPPNYGPLYTDSFEQMYAEVAQATGAQRAGFLLKDIADKPSLMLGDGIHPLAPAQATILANIWPDLEPLLAKEAAPAAAPSVSPAPPVQASPAP